VSVFYVQIVGVEEKVTLTENTGLRLKATQTFTDDNGVKR